MRRRIHRIVRAATGAIILIQLVSGCAQLGAAAAQVNWFKVGSYAALRLSTALNKKAEDREKENERRQSEEENIENAD